MTDIAIPTIPTAVIVLVNFFAPYFTAIIIAPFWPSNAKKWVAVGVSLVLAALALMIMYFGFGIAIPSWPTLLLLAVLVSQFSYTTLLKNSADAIAATTGVGKSTAVTVVSPIPALIAASAIVTPVSTPTLAPTVPPTA